MVSVYTNIPALVKHSRRTFPIIRFLDGFGVSTELSEVLKIISTDFIDRQIIFIYYNIILVIYVCIILINNIKIITGITYARIALL